jgi:hypothetical protein
MRFSIRWVLAAMAYFALVAAAMGSYSEFLFELTWVVSIVAFCYAAVFAIVSRGRRQAVAAGFVVMFVLHAFCVLISPDHSPVNWLYLPSGRFVNSGVVYEANANPRFQPNPPAPAWIDNVRVAYAAGTLLAGFAGFGIGALVWRNSEREELDERADG